MSLPSFDDTPVSVDLSILPSSGTGNRLPIWLLALCGSFTVVGTFHAYEMREVEEVLMV